MIGLKSSVAQKGRYVTQIIHFIDGHCKTIHGVDTETIDGRQYSLVTVEIPDSSVAGFRNGTYLRMVNPSTDEIHFEGVPNLNGDRGWGGLREVSVKDALAWRDNDTGNEYEVPIILT